MTELTPTTSTDRVTITLPRAALEAAIDGLGEAIDARSSETDCTDDDDILEAAESATDRFSDAIDQIRNAIDASTNTSSHWEEDPDWPVDDWRNLVANDDTRLGYRDWVSAQREQG